MTSKTDLASKYLYMLEPDTEFIGTVPLGKEFVVESEDSSGGQIRPGITQDEIDRSRLFPVTGPYEIEGIKKGDVVGIEIIHIDPADEATTWTRPGLGIRQQPDLSCLTVDTKTGNVLSTESPGEVLATMQPNIHVGALGLLPTERTEPRTLGSHGGNVDFSSIQDGATLWITAQVDGGGFFLGDVHYVMGHGEICGTGAEVAAKTTLKFHKKSTVQDPKQARPVLPMVTSKSGKKWIIGIGTSVEKAIQSAVDYSVSRVAHATGRSEEETYLLLGLLLEVELCQIVNPLTSVAISFADDFDRYLID